MTAFFLDWLQFIVETVGNVALKVWLVLPVVLASILLLIAVGYLLAQREAE